MKFITLTKAALGAVLVGAFSSNAQTTLSTVYESDTISPQNLDFNAAANQFPAHAGWYNNKLVHYYKFRIFAPGTYNGTISGGSTSADVPLQKVHVMTTTGDLTGVVGNPILQYHHEDGNLYSDFMEISYVTVDATYVNNTYTSVADVLAANLVPVDSGILVNMPLVPNGSTLEDPATNEASPILPVMAWYNGTEVQTFVFEVTDAAAKTFLDFTRPGNENNFAYSITVTPFASATAVNSIPLWHINQFSNGVTNGVNSGGPSPDGMRNIINLDRNDDGYSPLWQIFWGVEMPNNYEADDLSSNTDIGPVADFFTAPMFVNCPDIGVIGEENTPSTATFVDYINTTDASTYILGSHADLIFMEGVELSVMAGNTSITSVTTNIMGAYEFELATADIPENTTSISITNDGTEIRSINVVAAGEEPSVVVSESSDEGTHDSHDSDEDHEDSGAFSNSLVSSVVVAGSMMLVL